MLTRKEIKTNAKTSFKAMYWPCVGTCVLFAVVVSCLYGTMIGGALLAGPLAIGLNFFFVQCIMGNTACTSGVPFQQAFDNYGRKLGGYWLCALFTFLWSLLFIIPGIIKSFAYAMAPYILSDCSEVKADDTLKLSMRIMKGKKWKLFWFKFSFIGWDILSVITFGILGIFYVAPYKKAAMACWYLEAREDAIKNGVVTVGQLEGTETV